MRRLSFAILICILFFSCKKDAVNNKVVTNEDPNEGKIYLSPFRQGESSGELLVLDKQGNVLNDIITPAIAVNFREWNLNGTVRYTYLLEDHIPTASGSLPGYVVIADENMQEIGRAGLLSYGAIDAGSQPFLDGHDFILLGDDHYISMAYYEKTASNIPASLNPAAGVQIVAPVIQEVENNQVVWQWDASDHPELYGESVEGNNFSDNTTIKDYLHLNAISIDPNDGNLICSFRNANLVIKISKTTGDILWKLGGQHSSFPINEDQKFLRQHHASFADNGATILLFDNGEATERPYSRVLEFKLNESEHEVTGFKKFNIPEAFTQYMGSVQKSGDTYFIGGGTANYILEINPSTGTKSFEMQLAKSTYRAFKY